MGDEKGRVSRRKRDQVSSGSTDEASPVTQKAKRPNVSFEEDATCDGREEERRPSVADIHVEIVAENRKEYSEINGR